MKILLLSSSYPPVLGGLQTAAHALAAGLIRQGHETRVVTNRYPRKLAAREVMDGVRVSRWLFLKPEWNDVARGRLDIFLASFFYYPLTLLKLLILIKKFNPDVVNLHFPDSQIHFIRIAKRLFKFKLILTFHGHDIQRFFDGDSAYSHDKIKPLLREMDAATACSRNLLNRVSEIDPLLSSKLYLIGNGIDPERFKTREAYRHPKPYLFASGRLTPVKGFDLLIEAFAGIAPGIRDLDLIIAGEGEEKEKFAALILRLGMKERIHLIGRASPEEIIRLLNGCEFAVVSSRSEQFGIAALEAMAAGKSVLATRVGGLPEFVDEAVNQLVEPSVQGLSEGLSNWVSRLAEVRLQGERNRKEALKHTLDKVVERYLEIY